MKRVFVVVVALIVLVGLTAPAGAGVRPPLTANLSGANEVPGPGDADGVGKAAIYLDAKHGEVCFIIEVKNIAPAVAAHIHVGTAKEAGPVVVDLNARREGLKGCVGDVDKALIRDIKKNPAGYYVNVHNADFPPGAVRGQLTGGK